jgi:MFS family permease
MSQADTSTMHRGNLVAAMAAVAAADIALGLVLQVMPLLIDRAGYPAWVVGLNAAMGPIGILVAAPYLPRIIGNFGTRRAAFLCVAVMLATLALIAASPIWAWFPLRFLFGMAVGGLFIISEAWVLTFSGDAARGRVMGIYTSMLAATFAVGPLIVPWTGITGWLPWAIGIACIAVASVPLLFVQASHVDFRQKEGGGVLAFARKAPLLLFAVLAATLYDNVLISFFTIFGLRHGLDLDAASRILGFGIIGNVVMFYPMGWLADHWSRRGVVIVTAVSTIALSLSLIVLIEHWLIWPAMLLLTAMAFGVYVVALATLGDLFRGPDLMAGTAAIAIMWGLGGLIGPPLAGAAIDAFGIDAMPVTLALFYVILLIGLSFTGGHLVKQHGPESLPGSQHG